MSGLAEEKPHRTGNISNNMMVPVPYLFAETSAGHTSTLSVPVQYRRYLRYVLNLVQLLEKIGKNVAGCYGHACCKCFTFFDSPQFIKRLSAFELFMTGTGKSFKLFYITSTRVTL